MIEIHLITNDEAINFCLINRATEYAYYSNYPDQDLFDELLKHEFGWPYTSEAYIFDTYEHILLGSYASYNDFILAHPELLI